MSQDYSGWPDYKPMPPVGAKEDELCRIVDSRILHRNLLWLSLCAAWRKPELYDQNEQWLQRAFSAQNTAAPWQFIPIVQDPEDPASLPTPVFNYGFAPRVNETVRLAKPHYYPECRPNIDNPNVTTRIACKRMTQALMSELYRMRWATEMDVGHYRMPIHGTWFVKGSWEQSWDEVIQVPVKGAVACPTPGCDFTLASPVVTGQQAQDLGVPMPGPDEENDTITHAELNVCPQCADHPPLQTFQPSMEEIKGNRQDTLGRPMGTTQPLGQWKMETLSPYEVFLPNLGVDLRYDNIPSWTEVRVRDLDWVAAHYPEQAYRVLPENQAKLMEYHPIGGSPLLYGRGSPGALFNHHVRVKEYYEKPRMVPQNQDVSPGVKSPLMLNKGRVVVTANNVVLLDTDYLMPSLTKSGDYVERAWLELIPWELKEGGHIAYGMSMWDLMFGAQDMANEVRSQTAAVRQRGAVPFYMVDKSARLEIPEMQEGVPFRVVSIDITPGASVEQSFRLVNNNTISDGVYKEAESAIAFLNDTSGRSEVERGGVPPGVSAATAISQLRQESGTSREARQQRIDEALRRLYSYGARLISALWIEPRTFSWDKDGQKRWDKVAGADFLSQTEVEIAARPRFDSKDAEREAIRDVVTLLGPQLYTPQGKRVARALDAPSSLFGDDDIQDENAEREWMSFIDDGKRPVVDPTLDAHGVHWDRHTRDANNERFLEMEEKADWDGALRYLGGSWFSDLQQIAAQPPPPDTVLISPSLHGIAPTNPQTGQPLVQDAQSVPYATAAQMGFVPPAGDLQDKIEAKWAERLAAWQWMSPDPETFKQLLTWRAHSEAHRLLEEAKQQVATAQPTLAAPGAPQTMAGTQVTPSTPTENIMGQAPMPGQVGGTNPLPSAPIPSPKA